MSDRHLGLCQREVDAFHMFLNRTSSPWLFRAIDDTWILPENMIEFVSDLEQFVNPYQEIVVKSSRTRNFRFSCAPWLEGGIGWLMSRAAVRHFVEYDFVQICTEAFLQQDDTTAGLILCHTFPDERYWDSPRFPGNPYYYYRDSVPLLNFSRISIRCSGTNIWPINKIVSVHTSGKAALQAIVRTARSAPSDLAFESHPHIWRLCRSDPRELAALTTLESLKKWTPIVKFVKEGHVIPWDLRSKKSFPVDCTQCTGWPQESQSAEEQRLAKWASIGWKGYPRDRFNHRSA
jgi:hypothetical protein